MGYNKKTWQNRLTEFPTRRTITKSDSTTEIVTVTRNEGDIYKEGDAFSASTMNDLEGRVDEALSGLSIVITTEAARGTDNTVLYFCVEE